MLISLKSEVKEHLLLLKEQHTQVVIDFCKLAINFLHNGPNNRLYLSASNKLNIEFSTVQNCVYGLVYLLIISCKNKLSDVDFRDTILTLDFPKQIQNILLEFYKSKTKEVTAILNKLASLEIHYNNLEWRFEVLIKSRCLLRQVTPIITLELELGANALSNKNKKQVLLQTDPSTVLLLVEKLEKSLKEYNRLELSKRRQIRNKD